MHGAAPGRHGERVWDPLVRLTHWTIALAVLLNGLIVEGDAPAHVWIGYAALAMLAIRLAWGFIGPEEARFSAFPPSLRAARAHVAEILASRHGTYPSHNPLGAIMAYSLWFMLILVGGTGIAMSADPFPVPDASLAPYAAEEEHDEGRNQVVEEIHETAADLLLVLAALHVGGVAFESRRTGRNLARGMIVGPRR